MSAPTDAVLGRARQVAAATFSSLAQVDTALLVVTGDIAWSGQKTQYQLAQAFLLEVQAAMKAEAVDTDIEIAVCPGNHDCDFTKSDAVREVVIASVRSDPKAVVDESLISAATTSQNNFFGFRDEIITAPIESGGNRLAWVHRLRVGGRDIGVRCLNVAWMSSLKEREGTLVFPETAMTPISYFDNSGLSITILHHPFNWFSQTSYRTFRAVVRQESHLILTGHEHSQNVGEIHDLRSSPSVFVEGGVLHESTSDTSTFNTILIDIDDDKYVVKTYAWNGALYEPDPEPGAWGSLRPLPHKDRHTRPLTPEFATQIDDPGATFSHSAKRTLTMSDLFVWPEIRYLSDSSIVKRQVNGSYFEAIENVGAGIFMRGEEKTGKTTLLHQLFKSYHSRGFVPLYVNGRWLQKQNIKDPERGIKFALSKQYEQSVHQAILQESRDNKLLFVDDIDLCSLKGSALSQCLTNLFRSFGAVVVTAKDGAEAFDAFSFEHVPALDDLKKLEIREFGHRKRYELVRRWAAIGDDNTALSARQSMADVDKWEKHLTTAVGRQFVPSVPIFLLTLLQSIDGQRSADLQNSALGHYYQYLITSALERTGVRHEQWAEIFNYCSNLAWSLQSSLNHTFTESELLEFNRTYSTEFTPVSFKLRLKHLVDAGILQPVEEAYKFRYPYLYYMFLGQYIAEHIHEDQAKQVIVRLCEELHLKENANTLLFISHHTRNPIVYELVTEALAKCFAEAPIFDFDKDVDLLNQMLDSAPKMLFQDRPSEDLRATARSKQDEYEDDLRAEPKDDLVLEASMMTRLFRGMEILGQFLKNHYGTTRNPVKNDLIEALVRSSLRGLHSVTEGLRARPEMLVEYIESAFKDARDDLQEHDRSLLARQFVFDLTGLITFAFVQKAATCVGSEYLKANLSEVVDRNASIAFRVVEMSQQLDLAEPLPFDKLKALHKDLDRNIFATALLRSLALKHLHLFKVSFRDKQRLCSELGIELDHQLALERGNVMPRRSPLARV